MGTVGQAKMNEAVHSSARGNASQFFVAGELCRRGYAAAITLGNTPTTDILCSDLKGARFVHIQVKTFHPGDRTCSVGLKAEKLFGKDFENFFWVLGGIPDPGTEHPFAFEYYVIPASEMAAHVSKEHEQWSKELGKDGRPHNDEGNTARIVHLPTSTSQSWAKDFKDRWDLIEEKLGD
jgi:hypothetical protein